MLVSFCAVIKHSASNTLALPPAFTRAQAYGESGMTVLEELIDAAFCACDVGHAQGQQRVTGAALLTRSGKMYVDEERLRALYDEGYRRRGRGGVSQQPQHVERQLIGHPQRLDH